MTQEIDIKLLRYTFELAENSAKNGNFPFACILVNQRNEIILEAQNQINTGKNNLFHAELVLLLEANSKYSFEEMKSFSVYASAEPCPMCAAAVYWSGIGRLVYGLSSSRKNKLSEESGHISMNMPCINVITSGNRQMEIIGPLLEDEAIKVHE